MSRSKPVLRIVAVSALLAGVAVHADEPYVVVDSIPGPDGGYDYASFDGASDRLFVAREYGVMAVDVEQRAVTPKLVSGNDLSAVLIVPGTPLMLSTNWGGDTATLFERATGKIAAEIKTGDGPDAAAFDPLTRRAFVMNSNSGDVTVIDIATRSVVGTVPLGGKPEAGVADGQGRVYVNVEDSATIAVIDVASLRVVARHALPGCEEPTGLAYDPASRLLIAACHNRTVKLVDAASGADRGSVVVCSDADGALLDERRHLVYVPCDDGTLTILSLDAAGTAKTIQAVQTRPGARTAAFDPDSGRVYLPVATFETDASGERKLVPGTFAVLVVAPR